MNVNYGAFICTHVWYFKLNNLQENVDTFMLALYIQF